MRQLLNTRWVWLLLFPLSLAAYAQHPAPAPAQLAAPKLTATESIALNAVGGKLQANQKEQQSLLADLHSIEADIAVQHPGYRFDEATGSLVKNAPVVATPKTNPTAEVKK